METNARIQFSTDTDTNWSTVDPTLREGEMVFAKKTSGKYKMVLGGAGGTKYSASTTVWDEEDAEAKVTAMNEAVSSAQSAAETAEASNTATASNATAAAASASQAAASQVAAKASETSVAANATSAQKSATAAANSASTATTQAGNAAASAASAATAQTAAEAARDAASSSATAAGKSATEAASSASSAGSSATAARTAETNAGKSATAAAESQAAAKASEASAAAAQQSINQILETSVAFTGATSDVNGTAGLVPAPAVGDQNKALAGDGTWKTLFTESDIAKIVHPVGSVLAFADDTDPNTKWSGMTWVQFAQGRTLVGAGTYSENGTNYTYNNGETGGEAKHKLSLQEAPGHTHSGTTSSAGEHDHTYTSYAGTANINGNSYSGYLKGTMDRTTSLARAHTHTFTTSSAGGNGYHENRQPYIIVAYWKRTA